MRQGTSVKPSQLGLLAALLLDVERGVGGRLGEGVGDRAKGPHLLGAPARPRDPHERVGRVDPDAHGVGEAVVLGHLAEEVGLLAEALLGDHLGAAGAAGVLAQLGGLDARAVAVGPAGVDRADDDAAAADRGVAGIGLQALALQQAAARGGGAEVLDVRDVATLHASGEDDGRAPDGGRGLGVGGRGDALQGLLGARRHVHAPDVAAARGAALVDRDDVAVGVGSERDVPRALGAGQRRLERAARGVAQREDVAAAGLVERRPRLPAAVPRDGRRPAELGHRLVGRGRGGGDERERGERQESTQGHGPHNGARRRRSRSCSAQRIPSAISRRWWGSLHVAGKCPSAS